MERRSVNFVRIARMFVVIVSFLGGLDKSALASIELLKMFLYYHEKTERLHKSEVLRVWTDHLESLRAVC